MSNYLKNKLILCVFFSLFSTGTFALFIAGDDETLEESPEEIVAAPQSNPASLTFEELTPEAVIAAYEQAIEQLMQEDAQSWSKYRIMAQYMAPRLLLWGAGIGFFIYSGEKNILNSCVFVPMMCKIVSAGYYALLKPVFTGLIRRPVDALMTFKNTFSIIYHSPYIWVPIFGANIWVKNDFPLSELMPDKRLLSACGHIIQLFSEAQEACGMLSVEEIKQRLIDKKVELPLTLAQCDNNIVVNLEQIVGTTPFFKINEANFLVKYDQNQCAVCQEEWKPGEQVADMLPCLHRFHQDCIKEWIEKNSKCPSCRNNIAAVLVSLTDFTAP